MRENERNNRNLAVGGIIGGVLMMLANIIIHMGTTGKTPDRRNCLRCCPPGKLKRHSHGNA